LYHLIDDEGQGKPEGWEEGAVVLSDGFVRDFCDLLTRVPEVWKSLEEQPDQMFAVAEAEWEARATRSLESSAIGVGQYRSQVSMRARMEGERAEEE